MERDNFIKLKIGQVIYNKHTNDVCILESQWSHDKKEVKNSEFLSITGYDGSGRNGLRMSDYEDWETAYENLPEKVEITIMRVRLLKLEQFVYGRLR
jgi:hypothetical protein